MPGVLSQQKLAMVSTKPFNVLILSLVFYTSSTKWLWEEVTCSVGEKAFSVLRRLSRPRPGALDKVENVLVPHQCWCLGLELQTGSSCNLCARVVERQEGLCSREGVNHKTLGDSLRLPKDS